MSSISLDLWLLVAICVSILAGCWAAWFLAGRLRKLCEQQWDDEYNSRPEAFRIPEDCNDQPK